MEDTARIRIKNIDRLARNMHIHITTKTGDQYQGYFKRFFYKDTQGKNVYRATIQELLALTQGLQQESIYIFFTDSEQDPPKVQGSGMQAAFVKSESVMIKNIKEMYLIPPAALIPFLQEQQMRIGQLKEQIATIDTKLQQLQDLVMRKSNKDRSSKQ